MDFGPYYESKDKRFQIDLLIQRSDHRIHLVEIKCSDEPVGTEVIPEVRRKLELFPVPKGYSLSPVLISAGGATNSLKKSEFFDEIMELQDFFHPVGRFN